MVNVSIYEISIAAVMFGIYYGGSIHTLFYVFLQFMRCFMSIFAIIEAELYFIWPTTIYYLHNE